MLNNKLILVLGCLLHIQSTLAIWGCSQDADCTLMQGSVCQNRVCVCPFGTQNVLGGRLCAPVAPYHWSACYDNFQCSRLFTSFQCTRFGNSAEDESGHCTCASEHHYLRGRCWPNRTLGQTCSADVECMGALRDPFAMSCTGGTCQCAQGYFMRQRGECRKMGAAVGDPCVLDHDCNFDGGACRLTGTGPFQCYFRETTEPPTDPPPTAPPGEQTDPEDGPQTPPPQTTPPPITFPPIIFPPITLPPTDPEEPPTNPGENDPEKPPTNPGENDPEKPPTNPGENDPEKPPTNPGENDPEKPPTNPGDSKLGALSSRLLANASRSNAMSVSQYGAPCNPSLECAPQFECSPFGLCFCPLGYYPNAGQTGCLAELGSPVSADRPCVGVFTEVRDGVCACWPNFYFHDDMRSCVKASRQLSDSCIMDANCHTFGAYARCGAPGEWGIRHCECDLEHTVWDESRQMCRLFAGIGDMCDLDSDCMAGDLEINCVKDDNGQGWCQCPPQYTTHNGLCLTLDLDLGQACQDDLECENTDNAYCSLTAPRVCSCRPGYQNTTGGVCSPMLGGSCEADADCTTVIKNTLCHEETHTCQCQQEFIEYEQQCWQSVDHYGSLCSVDAQCAQALGAGGVCVGGNCTCSELHHFRDGGCWPRTGLFETCARSSQCFVPGHMAHVQCRNSLCQCSFDYPFDEELGTCRSSAASLLGNAFVVTTAIFYLFSR